MKIINRILFSLLVVTLLAFTACQDRTELTAPSTPSSTPVSFARFVSMGNSITAGYQSGSLYQSGQVYAYGNQIANLLGVTYVQPLISDPGTTGRMEFGGFTTTGIAIKYNTNSGVPLNSTYAAPYNDLAIPGAIAYDIIDTTNFATKSTARANPLFSLVLRNKAFGNSMIAQALAQNPTVITLWIGNNDVLGYASSGGTSGTDAATHSLPTDVPTFTYLINTIANTLATSSAKVIFANIPSISSIPFFTTIPPVLVGGDGTHYTVYGVTKTGTRALVYGQDLVLLTASSVLFDANGAPTGVGLSPANPLPDKYILDKDEVTIVNNAVSAFNTAISNAATAKGFALVDINTLFSQFNGGKVINGITFSPAYVTGGLFSLDGVHPTAQGQAILANAFIAAINAKWGSSIPYIDVSTIPGSLIIGKQIKYSGFGLPIIEKGAFDNILF